MDYFFAPMACSMSGRIAFYEAGAPVTFREVDNKAKRLVEDGSDYLAINPQGLVPMLRLDDGTVLTENAAILQAIARKFPGSAIALPDETKLPQLQQWLSFVGTELHKATFTPLLSKDTSDETKAYALAKGRIRLGYLDQALAGRETLLDRFSVADAYLFTVLNWSMAIPALDLNAWPHIAAYVERIKQRPSVARALGEEFALYQAEQKRRAA